jgi:DNA (cytosine-5)-methyltransferase 1
MNRKVKSAKKYSVVSMFSGCGGMDLGFIGSFKIFGRQYDPLPFEIIWANDVNAAACKTYRRNLGREIHCGDVWRLMDSLPKSADVLIGGFPCQDVSVNGKGTASAALARTGLYKAMVEAIRRIRPKVFVAENVKGLLMKSKRPFLNQILGAFYGLGYWVHYDVYEAADYGVPQTRQRVLFVGTSSGVKPFVPPAPERTKATWMTAREAIADLERLTAARPDINHIWSLANISPEQGNRQMIPGRPAYTIRAEHPGNTQFHYRLPRRVSIREAARFQSFPDNFIFEGGLRETERQVGNAVPPVLAWHIAKAVLTSLE